MPRRLDPDLLRSSGALLGAQLHLGAAIDAVAVTPTGFDRTILDLLVRLDLADGRQERAARLCRQLNLSAGHMSRTIDRAETAGLVERRPDPTDRRAQVVTLTAAGDAVLADFAPRLHGLLRRVVHDTLDRGEIETLVGLLERIEAACVDAAGPGADEPESAAKETVHA